MLKDKRKTHIQVVKAMQEEFFEKGFEKTSMRHISKKCGLTASGLYRHFSCKEDMFDAFMVPLVTKIQLD